MADPRDTPASIFLRFLRFGLLAWGGPAAQIAMIRDEIVDRERWITREAFNRALAVYQVLPGPEAHELCVYLGIMRAGRLGGLLAGLGFMLPGLALMLLGAWAYAEFGLRDPIIIAAFSMMHACIAALIVRAVVRIGSHAAADAGRIAIAGAACCAELAGAPFALSLPLAGLAWLGLRPGPAPGPTLRRAAGAAAIAAILGLALWSASMSPDPTASAAAAIAPDEASIGELGISGLRAGLLTFGGAYTVIPFLENDILREGWMSHGQFLDGIAIAGVIPAPFIIIATFVGFIAGGPAGAGIMTIAVFLPAFGFTLIGHRLVERLIAEPRLHALLDGVTAGVVGIIAATAARVTAAATDGAVESAVFLASLLALSTLRSRWVVPGVVIAAGALGAARGIFLG